MSDLEPMLRHIIQQSLKVQGKTQRGLAEYMGFSQKHISLVLTGKNSTSIDNYRLMLEYVGFRFKIEEIKNGTNK
jgi:transcriptional regulator with XRE-family HTH domain